MKKHLSRHCVFVVVLNKRVQSRAEGIILGREERIAVRDEINAHHEAT